MRQGLLFLFAALSLLAQDTPRHDQYADDPKAYCWNPRSSGTQGKQRERDAHAHRCDCHLVCQIGVDGSVIGDQEDATCALYCTRTHCFCHVEEPCEKH